MINFEALANFWKKYLQDNASLCKKLQKTYKFMERDPVKVAKEMNIIPLCSLR